MAARLLPTNASELERLAAEAFAQIERVPGAFDSRRPVARERR